MCSDGLPDSETDRRGEFYDNFIKVALSVFDSFFHQHVKEY